MTRSVFEVDASVIGHDFKEGVHGLRRFVNLLQDLMDEEGLPIDVRIGVSSDGSLVDGLRGLQPRVPEWIVAEAKRRFFEKLPD